MKDQAATGDAEAQYELGKILSRGEITPPDIAESFEWYRKAAEQGHANAQVEVGEMYCDGKGVEQDSAEGLKWLLKAAEQGSALAPFKLYFRYWDKRDYAEAYFWGFISFNFTEPSKLIKNSSGFNDQLAAAAQLTAEQRAVMEKRIDEWAKAHPRTWSK